MTLQGELSSTKISDDCCDQSCQIYYKQEKEESICDQNSISYDSFIEGALKEENFLEKPFDLSSSLVDSNLSHSFACSELENQNFSRSQNLSEPFVKNNIDTITSEDDSATLNQMNNNSSYNNNIKARESNIEAYKILPTVNLKIRANINLDNVKDCVSYINQLQMVNYALKLKLLYYENFLVKTDGKWENRDFLVQENVILKRIRSRIKGEVGRLFELTASDRSRGCSYDEVKEVYDVVFMHQDEIYSTLWEQPNPAGSACKSTSLERAESFLSPTEHPDFAYKEEINKLTKKIDYLREKLFFYEEKERKDGDYLRKYDELEALYSSTKAKLYEMEDENALLKTRFTALSVEVKEAKCSYQEAREHNDALLKNIKRLANRKHWALLHELRGRFPNVHLQSFKSGLEGNKNNTALLRKTFPTMTHKVEENGTAANKSDSAREQDEEAPGIIVTNSVRDVEKRKIASTTHTAIVEDFPQNVSPSNSGLSLDFEEEQNADLICLNGKEVAAKSASEENSKWSLRDKNSEAVRESTEQLKQEILAKKSTIEMLTKVNLHFFSQLEALHKKGHTNNSQEKLTCSGTNKKVRKKELSEVVAKNLENAKTLMTSQQALIDDYEHFIIDFTEEFQELKTNLQRCYEFLKPSEEVKASQQSQYNYFYKQIENYEKMFENLKNLEIQNRENTSELEVNLQKCEEENLQMSYKVETLSELCTAISEEKEKLKSFYKELINVNKHLTNELEWRKKEYEQHEERYTNHIEELQKTIAFLNCELEKSKDEYEQQKKDHARISTNLAEEFKRRQKEHILQLNLYLKWILSVQEMLSQQNNRLLNSEQLLEERTKKS